MSSGKRERTNKRVHFAIDDIPPSKTDTDASFIEKLVRFHKIQTANLFAANYGEMPSTDEQKYKTIYSSKRNGEYGRVLHLDSQKPSSSAQKPVPREKETKVVAVSEPAENWAAGKAPLIPAEFAKSAEQMAYERRKQIFPEWHAPWKLKKVISGHLGWVRCVAVDVSNDWFITGGGDRTIKIWDLATGTLKLTLTGHTTSVRGLCVSPRHPYIFSCGEDKTVRCWDFEQNKVIRKYHGHLSGVYGLSLHPTIDVLVSVGRDSVARVWDVRTKAQIFVLSGHKSTVACVKTQEFEPQVITGSHDHTMRLWDLRTGTTASVLTHHKKSIRDLVIHPTQHTFVSAAADAIKVWKSPKGDFLRNISRSDFIYNSISINKNDVLVTGGDEGTLNFWDYKTGYNFQTIKAPPQPGSLESEAGIFASTFDQTGSRLITCESDKTIKIWKEDENATPESHPINYKPRKQRRYLL